MANTEQYREHIECTFNAFYKIVLYHAALEAYKKLRKKQQFEISLDYLHEFNFEPVTTTVIVESDTLAAALLRLPKKRREVLFLRYYLGYSDEEISKMCGISRSAVFRRRKIALHLMRKEMEVFENEE